MRIFKPATRLAPPAARRNDFGTVQRGRGSVLTHADMTAGNTLDHPNEVKPAPFTVTIRGSKAEIRSRHAQWCRSN